MHCYWTAPLGTKGASIDCTPFEVWAVSAVYGLRTVDVLDTHFIEVFEVSAVPAVSADASTPLAVEPGPSGCKQPDGPRAVSAAPFWSRMNDA